MSMKTREKQNEVLRQLMEAHKEKLKNSKNVSLESSSEKLTTIDLQSMIKNAKKETRNIASEVFSEEPVKTKKREVIKKKQESISDEEFFNAFQKPKEDISKYLATSPVVNFIHKVSQTISNVSSNKKKKVKNLWRK
jgi:phage I-like protein